ncbi:hypothetical protein IMSAGC016_00162 [Muribaculaceae bacterium]|nr:hypothetical protein IMSAGC016_00162 [Muribaculaceae bacterium]
MITSLLIGKRMPSHDIKSSPVSTANPIFPISVCKAESLSDSLCLRCDTFMKRKRIPARAMQTANAGTRSGTSPMSNSTGTDILLRLSMTCRFPRNTTSPSPSHSDSTPRYLNISATAASPCTDKSGFLNNPIRTSLSGTSRQ